MQPIRLSCVRLEAFELLAVLANGGFVGLPIESFLVPFGGIPGEVETELLSKLSTYTD